MINLDQEELILLSDVPAAVPWLPRRRGRKLHVSALYRWVRVGINSTKLEAVKTPAGLATTESKLREFIASLNGERDQPHLTHRAEAARLRTVNSRLDQLLGSPSTRK